MNNVIIACDFSHKEDLYKFLNRLEDRKPYLKIGMELFYAEGPKLVKELKEDGYSIFLDLKLHDIPNTVFKAIKNCAKLGVDMINIHASGGIEMMQRAKEALNELDNPPLLIAVTMLTSLNDEILDTELLIKEPVGDTTIHYARNALAAGLDGVVCSPLESRMIHESCGSEFITVTPGIRLAEDSKDDQKRVTTPKLANELGSNFIVVGRSITGSENPKERYDYILEEFNGKDC